MSETTPSWTTRHLYCKFFARGACRNREFCEFSHDPSSIRIPDDVCLFHLQSKCFNGVHCRFQHWTIDEICSAYTFSDTPQETVEDVPLQTEHHQGKGANLKEPLRLVPFNSKKQEPSSSSLPGTSSKSYAQVTNVGIPEKSEDEKAKLPLCPFYECPQMETCTYIHGDACDLCNQLVLHPYNPDQRKEHRDECIKEHEKEMELSFAIQRSLNKTCGICMDVVMEKEPISLRRFGILEKCTHIFCLSCIRQWRQTKQFDSRTIRACPECRVSSGFVIPSEYWVDEKSDKEKLIDDYKKAMSNKPCKYFNERSNWKCPFGSACFYLHAKPDGTRVVLDPPQRRVRRNGADGDTDNLFDILLWNYIESRDDPDILLSLDLEDLIDMRELGLLTSTDDESDYDYDDDY